MRSNRKWEGEVSGIERRRGRQVLALQQRARDHDLEGRIDDLERILARVHARIDGALVTIVPLAQPRRRRRR